MCEKSRWRAISRARSVRLMARRGSAVSTPGVRSPAASPGSVGGTRIPTTRAAPSTVLRTPSVNATRRTRRQRRPVGSRNTADVSRDEGVMSWRDSAFAEGRVATSQAGHGCNARATLMDPLHRQRPLAPSADAVCSAEEPEADRRLRCYWLNHATIEQRHLSIGVLRVPRIVRHHADGAAVRGELAQQLHHGLAVC